MIRLRVAVRSTLEPSDLLQLWAARQVQLGIYANQSGVQELQVWE